MPSPVSLSFGLPFDEAIAAARARKVLLPGEYYGQVARGARRVATTVSGLAGLDQAQAVIDSVRAALARGDSFGDWQRAALSRGWDLPAGRLETIFRTNVQTAYAAGHWRQFQANKLRRPYLMWSAINDSRVRPAHLAMDGHIAPIDDVVWQVWTPPAGYNCRCSQISLTEEQAKARGYGRQDRPFVVPDQGFTGAAPGDLEGAVRVATKRKLDKVDPKLRAAFEKRTASLSPPPVARTIADAERWATEAVTSKGDGPAYPADPRDGGAIVRFRHPGAKFRADVREKKFGVAKFNGMKVEAANEVNSFLYIGAQEADILGIPRLRGVNTAAGGNGATMGDGVLSVNKNIGGWNDGLPPSSWRPTAENRNSVDRPRLASKFFTPDRQIEQTFWHEFGHHVHQNYGVTSGTEYLSRLTPTEKAIERLYADKGQTRIMPSRYSGKNSKEWFAESFSLFKMGRSDLIDPDLLQLIEKIYRGEPL